MTLSTSLEFKLKDDLKKEEQTQQFQAYQVKELKDLMNGQAKTKSEQQLIGECVLELKPLVQHLNNNPNAQPISQSLNFIRSANFSQIGEGPHRYNQKDLQQESIGRFNISLMLISDLDGKYGKTLLQSLDNRKPILSSSSVQHMPVEYPNYEWRVRVDLRAGIDMPLNSLNPHKMPSIYAEIAWSEAIYYETVDSSTRQFSIIYQESRHPHWNQQFIITNPPTCPEVEGFVWVSLIDNEIGEPFERFYIPMKFFKNFKPVHLEVHCRGGDYQAHPVIYLSVSLEKQLESFVDSLCSVTLHWADFDPIPYVCKLFNCLITTDGFIPSDTPYISVDLNDEQSLARAFNYQNNQGYSLFLTPALRIPPDPIRNLHNSLTYCKMPKSYLDRKIRVFVIVNEESKAVKHYMPNIVIGATEILDIDIRKILYSYSHEKMIFPVKLDQDCPLYKAMVVSKVRLEMACFPTEAVDEFFEENFELDYDYKKAKEKNEKMGNQYDYFDEKDRWKLYSKELAQKQEIIHRVTKDINDKSADLKQKGNEILDLRNCIKQLKLENYKLQQKIEAEERIENETELTKDILQMSASETKNKVLKLAQAYKTERLRNVEFENAIKMAYKDLDTIPHLEAELKQLQDEHQQKSQKLLQLQKETQKEQVYQETIKKQENVIARLESLLEKSVKTKERVRDNNIELDSMKNEIQKLQHEVKEASYGPSMENSELNRLRREINNLELLLKDLKDELNMRQAKQNYNENRGKDYEDWEDEKVAYEIKMQREQARVDSIEEEISKNASKFANEINMLKMMLAQKQATLQNMDVRPEDKIRL